MKEKISFFPKGAQQWFRVAIGLTGIILAFLGIWDIICFEQMASIATMVGFLGYIIDGLFQNVKEREDKINES